MELLILLTLMAFPGFLVATPLFPFWWIGRWRILRREGRWEAIRHFDGNWKRFTLKVVGLTYALLLALPFVVGFGADFWFRLDEILLPLFLIGLALLVGDLAVLMSFSPDRAVDLRRNETSPNRPSTGGRGD
jgi:hypothetical protein